MKYLVGFLLATLMWIAVIRAGHPLEKLAYGEQILFNLLRVSIDDDDMTDEEIYALFDLPHGIITITEKSPFQIVLNNNWLVVSEDFRVIGVGILHDTSAVTFRPVLDLTAEEKK